jgi:hypothetical protein
MSMKSRLKWRLVLVSLAAVGIIALLLVLSVIWMNYLVNFWWFDSLGYGFYYRGFAPVVGIGPWLILL